MQSGYDVLCLSIITLDCAHNGMYIINEIILRPFMGMTLFDTLTVLLSRHQHANFTISFKLCNCAPIAVGVSIFSFVDFMLIIKESKGDDNLIIATYYNITWILIHCIFIVLMCWYNKCLSDETKECSDIGDHDAIEGLILIILSLIAWTMLKLDSYNSKQSNHTFKIWRLLSILITVLFQMMTLFEWRRKKDKIEKVGIIPWICFLNLFDFVYMMIFEMHHFYELGNSSLEDDLPLLFRLSYTFSFAISHVILWTYWQYLEWSTNDVALTKQRVDHSTVTSNVEEEHVAMVNDNIAGANVAMSSLLSANSTNFSPNINDRNKNRSQEKHRRKKNNTQKDSKNLSSQLDNSNNNTCINDTIEPFAHIQLCGQDEDTKLLFARDKVEKKGEEASTWR